MSTLSAPRDAAMQVASYPTPATLPDAAQALFGADPALGFQSSRAWYEIAGALAVPAGSRPAYLLCTEAGRPAALFPLLDGADGARTSLTTPYTTLHQPLVAPGLDDAALRRAARAFGLACRAWPTMRIEALDADWAGLPPLLAGLRDAGLAPVRYDHFGNWHEDTAGRGWEGYLAERPGQLRETIRRKTRACERDGAVTVEVVSDAAALGPAMEAYEAVYARSWKEPEPYPDFGPAMMRAAAAAGVLRVGVLRHGGRAAAAQYWTVSAGRAAVLKLAHDEAFKPLSPGTVLTARMIRHLLEHERVDELDFGRGDDEYKRSWTAHRRQRIGLLVINPRRLAGLAALGRTWMGRARRRLRGA